MQKRIIIGCILACIAFLCVFLNSNIFNICVIFVLLYSTIEWIKLFNNQLTLFNFLYFSLMCILIFLSQYFVLLSLFCSVFLWIFIIFCIAHLHSVNFNKNNIFNKYCYILCFFIIIPFWNAIKIMHSNPIFLSMIITVISCTDIGAYFIGYKYGKHYIVPKISPNKTIEGFFGGILFGLISGIMFSCVLDISIVQHILLVIIIFFTIIISIFGDLMESIVKRLCNVKDSGTILPGHGGILDLLDSFFAGVPFFTLFIILIKLVDI